MGPLDGKVAVVSGAARGQGRAHAVRLAREGADIIAIDICGDIDTVHYPLARPDYLDETVAQIEQLGRRGAMVLISSVAAHVGMLHLSHYPAAKAGAVGLMCALAVELAPHMIRSTRFIRRA